MNQTVNIIYSKVRRKCKPRDKRQGTRNVQDQTLTQITTQRIVKVVLETIAKNMETAQHTEIN